MEGQPNPKEHGQSKRNACQSQDAFPNKLSAAHQEMEEDEFDMISRVATIQQHLDGQTVTTLQADVMSLQDRMGNMENLLQQVLSHFAAKGSRDSFREVGDIPTNDPSPWSALLAAGDIDGHEVYMNMSDSQSSPDSTVHESIE